MTLFWSDGSPCFDHLLRFENLADDFAAFLKERRLAPLELRVMNKQKRFPCRSCFDAEAREMLGGHFRRDIDMFGYEY